MRARRWISLLYLSLGLRLKGSGSIKIYRLIRIISALSFYLKTKSSTFCNYKSVRWTWKWNYNWCPLYMDFSLRSFSFGLLQHCIGWAQGDQGQRKIPTKQHPSYACWSRYVVDGLDRIQRWWSLCGQYWCITCRPQHTRVCGDQPPCLALPGHHLLRKAIRHWGCAGHDHWLGLHYTCSR